MDAVEFMRTHRRMCNCYSNCNRKGCPACCLSRCGIDTDEPEKLVNIVESWGNGHPQESEKKTIQDDLSGAIFRELKNYEDCFAESVAHLEENCYRNFQIIENHHIETYMEIVRLKERVAELEGALKAEPVPTPKPKPKQTRRDALLELFPTVEEYAGAPVLCPKEMDEDWDRCSIGGQTCEDCRRAFWLAEADEQ